MVKMFSKLEQDTKEAVDTLVRRGVTKKDLQKWVRKYDKKVEKVVDKSEDWIDKKLVGMNLKRR